MNQPRQFSGPRKDTIKTGLTKTMKPSKNRWQRRELPTSTGRTIPIASLDVTNSKSTRPGHNANFVQCKVPGGKRKQRKYSVTQTHKELSSCMTPSRQFMGPQGEVNSPALCRWFHHHQRQRRSQCKMARTFQPAPRLAICSWSNIITWNPWPAHPRRSWPPAQWSRSTHRSKPDELRQSSWKGRHNCWDIQSTRTSSL